MLQKNVISIVEQIFFTQLYMYYIYLFTICSSILVVKKFFLSKEVI